MPSGVMDQIRAAEERLRLAMLESDCVALDELIAPDLIFTNHFGRVLGKQDDLETHRSGLLRFHMLEPSEVQVNASSGLAVVSARMNVAGTFDGAPFAEDLRFTRVWRLGRGGTWEILTGHSSQVRE